MKRINTTAAVHNAIATTNATTAAIMDAATRARLADEAARLRLAAIDLAEDAARATYEAKHATAAERREAVTIARAARAAARRADDAATRAEVKSTIANAEATRLAEGEGMAIVMRDTTDADRALTAARARLAEAIAAEDAITDDTPADAVKAAKRATTDARRAVKAARAEAATAARAAARAIFRYGVNDAITRRPSIGLAVGYALADAILTAEAIPADAVRVKVCFDVATAEAITPAARYVAKKTIDNTVNRQGTPSQWRIARAAAAGDWTYPDLADMVDEAAVALAAVHVGDNAAAMEADALTIAADALDALPRNTPAARMEAAAIVREANTYTTRATSDPAKNHRRARMAEAIANATAKTIDGDAIAIEDATDAAFMAVNTYLTDARAIRAEAVEGEITSLDAIADDTADTRAEVADGEYTRRRREYIHAAIEAVMPTLTPTQKRVAAALVKYGGSERRAAEALGRDVKSIDNTRAQIARAIANALAEVAPSSIEAAAADLMAIYAAADAATIRAEAVARRANATARRARAAEAAREAATITAARVEAMRKAMATLTPAMMDALALVRRGDTVSHAAAVLGKSRATVREALTTARRRLAEAAAIDDATPLDAILALIG